MPTIFDAPNPNFETAVELTVLPRLSYPFQEFGELSGIIQERDFIQNAVDFVPTPISTIGNPGFYLIEETLPATTGNGLVTFTRRFGNVPDSFVSSDWEALTLPGFFADFSVDPAFRIPKATIAAITVEHDFQFANDASTISLLENKFQILTAAGLEIDYVDAGSTPDYTAYQLLISNSDSIVFKISEIRPAYGSGKVWEQLTFKVKAA